MGANDADGRLRRIEPAAALVLVLLKLNVLRIGWGHQVGFDSAAWLEVFGLTHWFEPLLPPRAAFNSYHPPLAFLLTRLVYGFHPHAVEACQIVSTLSFIGGFLALRSALRHIGWLWSVPGVCFLYGGLSLPVYVWLARETGCADSLSFFWFSAALALAVRLFWQPVPRAFWREPGTTVRTTLLGLVLAAGMLTKYTGIVAFGVPFLVLVVRRGPRAVLRESASPIAAAIAAVIVAAPLFWSHGWVPERQLMPEGVEWQVADELKKLRAERDAEGLAFAARMLRYPQVPLLAGDVPDTTSFPGSIWFQTWKKDAAVGRQSPLSTAVSNVYLCAFALLLFGGTALFLLRRRRISDGWWHLGCILLVILVVFSLAALAHAWQLPTFGWRPFKSKYMAAGLLWFSYAAALTATGAPSGEVRSPWRRRRDGLVLLALALFVFINHLLPVY